MKQKFSHIFKLIISSLKRNDGFTMIELMIAVTIIAILTATGVVIYRNYIIKARVTKAQIEIRQLRMAIDTFGTPPSTEEGLQKLVDEKIIKKSGLMDPWGHPYQYRSPGENDDVDIWSLGADGKEGGEGNNKDITSWELDK